MNGIKDILNKYITIKRIGKFGKFVILNTSIDNLEKELTKRSEQLVCDKDELDCPYDFTSRCTMGRCYCKPKAN